MENYKKPTYLFMLIVLLSIHVIMHIILYLKDRFLLFLISKDEKVVLDNDIENRFHRFHRFHLDK